MRLDKRQTRQLRTLAHRLKPVVMIGQHGVTRGVRRELDSALSKHELVKIRLPGGDRDARDRMLESLRADSGSTLVQQTGHTAVLFRRNRQQPVIALGVDQVGVSRSTRSGR